MLFLKYLLGSRSPHRSRASCRSRRIPGSMHRRCHHASRIRRTSRRSKCWRSDFAEVMMAVAEEFLTLRVSLVTVVAHRIG